MEKSIAEINVGIGNKIKSVARRTAADTAEKLRLKLAITELNYDSVLEERDYLMSTEWKPLIHDIEQELREALRLSKRLDYMSSTRVQEVLNRCIEMLGKKAEEGSAAA